MAVRVGIDLVAVDDVATAVETHADRYLARVYSPREVADCTTARGVDPRRLAACFAAKEAAAKVLRPGDNPLPWAGIELRLAGGRPTLRLTGDAAVLAERAGIDRLAVSCTRLRDYAAAVVTAEIPPTSRHTSL
jgi:holo-[acyl-carrier protein] synthase